MKATDKLIAAIDKKLERFDPIWQAEHGVGGQRSRYYDKTGVAKWREWRGVKDTFYDYTQWLNNLLSMVQMVASAPIPCLKGFWEYCWMGSVVVVAFERYHYCLLMKQSTVFSIREHMVIGPTPPRTGVITDARSFTPSKSTSP